MTAEIVGFDSAPGIRSVDAVFLHGYACSSRDWVPVVDHLGGHHLLVDFPAHGTRSSTAPAGFSALVDGVAALLAALGRPTVLVGHSMGGMVAIAVAAAHPGLMKGMVLADAFPYLPAVVEVFGGAEDPDDPFGYGSVIDRQTPSDVQARVRASMAAGVVTAGAELHADLMRLDLRPDLAMVRTPALVLVGDRHDPAARPESLARRLGLDSLRDARVELVSSHHFIMLEQPKTVARHIEEFLLDPGIAPKGKR